MESYVDYSNTYSAIVERQNDTEPWGIRLRGGVDINEPIVVHQIRRKSPASKAGVKEGDLVSTIDNQPTDGMTHQQVADILASPRLSLELTLIRQAPVALESEQGGWSSNETAQRGRHDEPLSPADFQVPQNFKLKSESKQQAIYKLSHQVQPQQYVKDYQPFDLLGGSSQTSQQHRKVYQVTTSNQSIPLLPAASMPSVTPRTETLDFNFTQPPPQNISHIDPSYRYELIGHRSRNLRQQDDSDVIDFGSYGPPRQSKSFMLIATALAAQGAGETGLPPPRSAVREHERGIESRYQLDTEWL